MFMTPATGSARIRPGCDLGLLPQRNYDPTIGRFTSFDTFNGYLSNPITLNHYIYAGGDPVNNIDPSGHDFIGTLGSISIGIGIDAWSGYSILAAAPGAVGAAPGANGAFAGLPLIAQAGNILNAAKDVFFDTVFEWFFYGTQQYLNVIAPSPLPGTQITLSVGASVNPVQGFSGNGSHRGGVARIFASGGLHAAGTTFPQFKFPAGANPPLKNWRRPIAWEVLRRQWYTPGGALRVPFAHGFQQTEFQDYLSGDIAFVVSLGASSAAIGLRLVYSFTDGSTRWEAGLGVGQGFGGAIELGATLKVPFN